MNTQQQDFIAANSASPKGASERMLLNRLGKSQLAPCFILACPGCGQEQLIQLFMHEVAQDTVYFSYEVDLDGSCGLALDKEHRASAQSSVLSQSRTTNAALPKEKHVALVSSLPWLEEDAAQKFSNQLDELVQLGNYVVVLCPPQNDRYQCLQSDRLVITAQELLAANMLAPEAYTQCLLRFMEEYLPLDIKLCALLTSAVRQTNVKELRSVGFDLSADLMTLLPLLSPLYSIDASGVYVCSEKVRMSELATQLASTINEYLLSRQQPANPSTVAARITALSVLLLERGDLENSHEILALAEALINAHVGKKGNVSLLMQGKDFNPEEYINQFALEAMALTSSQEKTTQNKAAATKSKVKLSGCKQETAQVDKLSLRLFGKLEVSHKGIPLNNEFLSRTKIRRLLAYLTFNQNRMIPREALINYLWPNLDTQRAQKNLYTSWSMLSKGLGYNHVRECPYIQRNGELYQLKSEYVVSDIECFEHIARSLLLDAQDLATNITRVTQLESLYSSSLAADIPADSYLTAKATSFKSLMVDCFLLVLRQVRAQGQHDKALYYARAAYELDESREDVYLELMDTQSMAGQRTSAMQTYLSCKQYLSDELGILPSKRTTALYQDLLLDSCF